MGGKSPGQPGAYDDPNPQPFVGVARTLMEGAMKNMGTGFWGPDMPTFGTGTPAAADQTAAPAPAGPAPAAAAPGGTDIGGATDISAPTATARSGSATTTQDGSMGSALAAAVTPNSYWAGQGSATNKKPTGAAPVTQT